LPALTDEDIADLKRMVRTEPLQFYKGEYVYKEQSLPAVRILNRHGFKTHLDCKTGKVEVTK
jgi:hypothetical protein